MATVTKGRTFISGETVTPARLNNLVDLATVTDIQTADIADGQITLEKLVAAVQQSLVPAGAVQAFAMNSAPTGWLAANGSAVLRSGSSGYPALFAAIGTTYGAGNGSTTFNLPDLRGEFVRGIDGGRGVDTGRVFGSAQLDQMQRITGSVGVRAGNTGGSPLGAFVTSSTSGARPDGTLSGGAFNPMRFDSGNSPNARVSATTDGETRSRNVAMLYCIKF